MNRSEILDTAKAYITVDRAAVHGNAESTFCEIAQAWNWWLGGRLSAPVTAYDVGMMMALFKLARAKGNPSHMDSIVDGAGYLALAGEMAPSTA
jgi:hypothetical protein